MSGKVVRICDKEAISVDKSVSLDYNIIIFQNIII